MFSGPWQILILAIIIILLFGSKKLPELARSLGKAKSEFSKGMKEGEKETSDGDGSGKPKGDA